MAAAIMLLLLCTTAISATALPSLERVSRPPPPSLDGMPPLPVGTGGTPITNLTVFVLPHSHDDTGWQRTVDQYYNEQVRYIYDTVVEELSKNPKRKFIFVETAYFIRWWREQNAETQATTKKLFQEGQIEFVNGAWCMADDASPSADAQIDQATLGHRYIQDIFGRAPRYAWHIDPFGLSASYAIWWKAMNYSAWLFNRVDTRLKDLWHTAPHHLQFHWTPEGAGTNPGIFSHVLDTHYGAPELTYRGFHYHFEFEAFGGEGGGGAPGSQGSGNPGSPFYNATAPAIAEAFVAMARLRASFYKLGAPHQRLPPGHAAILVPFGDDMKFQNAHKQYSNMDALMETINSNFGRFGVNVQYGTISDYMDLINQQADWPGWSSDFMPLATNGNVYTSQVSGSAAEVNSDSGYWTGHYTTRPLMKGLVARANGVKHTSEIAATLACARRGWRAAPSSNSTTLCNRQPDDDLMLAREVTGVLQHHDNIPGTSSPDAALNLDVRLRASIQSSDAVIRKAAGLATSAIPTGTDDLSGMRRKVRAGEAVVIFNPSPLTRHEYIEYELETTDKVTVTEVATNQVIPSVTIPPVPEPVGENSASSSRFKNTALLVINVSIPALSYKAFSISAATQDDTGAQWSCKMAGGRHASASINISNADGVMVSFDGHSGRMSEITTGHSATKFQVNQQFFQYHASSASNAYQFHPDRSKFPFGQPLDSNGVRVQLCTIKSQLLERANQLYLSGPPPPPPPAPPPEQGVDCTTRARCNATCPHMSNCADGVFYCCGHGNTKLKQCSGTHSCSTNLGLHDCACNAEGDGPLAGTKMLSETVTVYQGESTIETQTALTMLDKDRELVTRYSSDLDNTISGKFYGGPPSGSRLPVFETDSNGLLMLTRVINKTAYSLSGGRNESYFHVSSPVAGNYYPLASPGCIRISGSRGDSKDTRALGLLTDRAHGASGLKPGWMEVMLSRRVAEKGGITVDDTDYTTQRNWLLAGSTAAQVAKLQRLRQVAIEAPLASVTVSNASATGALAAVQPATEANGGFPVNLHLMSLDRVSLEYTEAARQGRVLLRIRHIFMEGEHPTLSTPATADLTALLPRGMSLSNVVELPLNGIGSAVPLNETTQIVVQPLETRTFEVTIAASSL